MAGAQAAHAHLGRSPPVGANKNGRHPAKFEFQTNNKYLKNICLKYCSRCTYAKKLSSVDLKFEPTRASCIIGDPPTLIRAGEILPKAWPPDALPCSPLGGRTEWALRGGGSPEFRARVAACGGPQRLSRGTRGGGGRARGAPRQRAGCRPEAELCQGWGPTRPVRWGPAGAVAAHLSHPRGRAVSAGDLERKDAGRRLGRTGAGQQPGPTALRGGAEASPAGPPRRHRPRADCPRPLRLSLSPGMPGRGAISQSPSTRAPLPGCAPPASVSSPPGGRRARARPQASGRAGGNAAARPGAVCGQQVAWPL